MIKNILFDFGGVFLDLDFKKSFDAFRELGLSNIEQLFTQFHAAPIFMNLETGKISPNEFYDELQQFLPHRVPERALEHAWNAMLGSYRIASLDYLSVLKKNYSVYLLSNTNEIHYTHFSYTLQQQTKYMSLESLFNKAYYSHIIHCRKPDEAAFAFVLQDANLKPHETLFIDDTITNMKTPQDMGFKTHHLLTSERIEQLDYLSY